MGHAARATFQTMAKAGEHWRGRGLDGIELTVDIACPIEAWRDRYASTVGMGKYRRAAAWATDETAKKAILGIRAQFHKTLKRNSQWTRSAVSYARADKAAPNGIEAGTRAMDEVFVMPAQTTSLKYLFGIGMGDNICLPGDFGLAQDKTLIP